MIKLQVIGSQAEMDNRASIVDLPTEQQAIRERCFHPTGTFVEFPQEAIEGSIPARFEEIVRLYPQRLAVKANDHAFTYAALNKVANRIARAIIAQGDTKEEPIALFFEQGALIIAAILAVLKSGRIYVPLDPTLPLARVEEILRDSAAKLVLTNTRYLSEAEELVQNGQHILNCDAVDADVSDRNPDHSVSSETGAIILYTSGSTGQPKGVLHNHRNILVETRNYVNDIRICTDDRLSLCQSCSFANSIRNIYGALLTGAALFPYDLQGEGILSLGHWINANRITIFHTLETVVRRMLETMPPDATFPHLRILRFGGEATSGEEVRIFQRRFAPNCVLMNVIGLTETFTIRRYFLPQVSASGETKVPLGYEVADKEVLLLDDAGQQVGVNETGEIAVRSKHLALGYWQRPDLTAAAFMADPYGGDERLYLTGDLGMQHSDGCLVHTGRKDFQVKVRGNKVDMTVIEASLLKLDSVRAAVVHPQHDNGGEQRLVAYVVLVEGKTLTLGDIHRALSPSLPDYMIPSALVFMKALPVVPNGRIDRRALPMPENSRPLADSLYAPPTTTAEEKLAKIWADILSLDQVGIHDNFFDLGGHSLAGARLVSRIHEEFGFHLPVSEFFADPTIARLARRIEANSEIKPAIGKKIWTYLCELQRGTDRKPVFVFPGGGGGEPEFFVYGFLARHAGTAYPFYGLRARGADGVLQPHHTVSQMADAYVEEIRAIQPEGPYFLVGECAGGVTAYEAARQLQAQGQKIATLVLMDVQRPTLVKYLSFRTLWWRRPIEKLWRDTVGKWCRENYFVLRIPYHVKQLRAMSRGGYPSYFFARLRNVSKPAHTRTNSDSPQTRAAAVLRVSAPRAALGHIDRVRENYRRMVHRFRPQVYDGHIELLVSEKLHHSDPTLGWKNLASKGLSIHPLPGDHESYIRDHVAVAGLKLRECLERAEGRLQAHDARERKRIFSLRS